MTTWNYRVVRRKEVWNDAQSDKEQACFSYGIHEAFCDGQSKVIAITEEPVALIGDTVEELRHAWVMMAEAFGMPILDYEEVPEHGAERWGDQPEENVDECVTDEDSPEKAKDLGFPDFDAYEASLETERLRAEREHAARFVGIPNLKLLAEKLVDDYLICRNTDTG
jgi:hypothetical protein